LTVVTRLESSIGDAIRTAAAQLAPISDEARVEAELLVAQALRTDRTHLLARSAEQLDVSARSGLDALIGRRLAREPLAYILGRREFYGIDFAVTPAVLIPRPETETLVERALAEIQRRGGQCHVVDVGTGSGAIAIAVASHAPNATIVAVDASGAALALAARNAAAAGVRERIQFRQGDLLEGCGVVDVIVANLPYIQEGEWPALPPEIRDYEPRCALVGGAEGTEIIEELLRTAGAHLATGGAIAAEIGCTQGARLSTCAAAAFAGAEICVEKDYAGLDRMLVVRGGG
jgi:release factor glutamine methyltransferase